MTDDQGDVTGLGGVLMASSLDPCHNLLANCIRSFWILRLVCQRKIVVSPATSHGQFDLRGVGMQASLHFRSFVSR